MTLAVMRWHPFFVLGAYALLLGEYRRNLDGDLNYIRPAIPGAREDILGFGFWVTWALIAAWFWVAAFLSFQFGLQRRASYWVPLFCAFALLSIGDLYLYGVLERQVLAG